MADKILKVRNKMKYDTEANWAKADPVLLAGEIAISSDRNNRMKVGDGKSKWSSLSFSGLKVGSNITLSSDTISITKANVTNALGYTPPTTNTTYSVATQSANGLLSADDKKKLDGIASGANKITIDTAVSTSSTNPLQNKVVTTELNKKLNIEPTVLTTEDLNNIKTYGFYYAGGSNTVKNKPTSDMNAFALHVYRSASGYIVQELTAADIGDRSKFIRQFTSSAWSAWSPEAIFSATPTSGQVVVTDGTTGKVKSSGYTIAKSVPSNAVFTDTKYTHPTYTARTSGLYKITVDGTGHVSAVTAVAKADITALGIPAQDTKYDLNTMINGLSTGSDVPKDADYYISQYAGGGTTTTTYHRRPVSALYSYIKAKTDTLYAAKTHTHNYAGSSSAGGSANSAVKLATARTISLSGDVTGSASFDGSANISILAKSRKCCFVGSDAANSNGWYKFGTITMSGYGDANMMVAIHSTYNNYTAGIMMIQLRSDNTTCSVKTLKWLSRIGIKANAVRAVISNLTINLYVLQENPQYGRMMIEVLNESSINGKSSGITLADNTTKESTEPASTISSSDGGTVSYANSAGSVAWGNVSNKTNASQSAAGLMSADDKKKLDGVASGANAYTHPSATAYASGLYKITTNNLGHVTAATAVTKADITGLGIPSSNTDTHYTTGLKIGASATATANAAATNGNVFLNLMDNTTIRDSHKIVGTGATSVTSDANGVITINSSNTTYSDASQSAHGLMTAADKKKLDGIASGANAYTHPSYTAKASGLYKVTVDATGHVSATAAVAKSDITALGIPSANTDTHYTTGLKIGASATATANAAATNGNVYINALDNTTVRDSHKIVGTGATSVTSDDNGVITINSSNTTYSDASQSAHGLMTAADKKKLDGIASGANAYTHPSATAYASGLYKITTNNLGHVTAAVAVAKADITALGIPASNTTYTVGTESYSGTTKLYGSTGSSTDGTMTRKAITDALGGKAASSHTHNYAGSSSAGGSANSAVKLATARTVSASTDFVMSFNYDGSANSTASLSYYNVSVRNGNKNNYPFHRFAKIDKLTGSYNDYASTFLITQDYQGGGWGIVTIRLRTNNVSSSQVATAEVKWLIRSGLSADFVQIALDNTAGATYADAFLKFAGTYGSCVVRNLASGARGGISRTWTLLTSTEVDNTTTTDALKSVESYATIAAAGTAIHNAAYKSTVVGSDAGTVSYANSAGSVAWGNVTSKANASQSAAGLMSADDKKKLDGIATGANAYIHPSATAYASGLYKITTNNLGHVTGATAVTKSDITALGIPSANTDTHYTSGLKVGTSATATSNAAATNGNVYLNALDNTTVRDSHKIVGSGATSVTSDANGVITISSSNTTYSAASQSAAGLMSADDKKKLDGIASGANAYSHPTATAYASGLYKITTNNLGHVTAATAVTKADITGLGIPASDTNTHYNSNLITGSASSSTANAAVTGTTGVYLNLVENGSIRNSHKIVGSGATKVTSDANGVITISSTNTIYLAASTTAAGLMTASDKTKLNGISSGAQNTVYSATQPTGQAIGDYWVKLEG